MTTFAALVYCGSMLALSVAAPDNDDGHARTNCADVRANDVESAVVHRDVEVDLECDARCLAAMGRSSKRGVRRVASCMRHEAILHLAAPHRWQASFGNKPPMSVPSPPSAVTLIGHRFGAPVKAEYG